MSDVAYRGVGIVRDIPDLKFSLESLDCSAARH